ncbi:hypothetical protein [Streptomyces sp. 5-10]|uniref:hypothetical protein n=1 Tax=Streptomyces sp. 5-10 TaxID=878925 RepID=UPI00168A5A43|nr:hypothetical protein [Streptomyces sp. 5-10]MBD3004833.1 hypothetical protein [Streptomyces sp. 5-10]
MFGKFTIDDGLHLPQIVIDEDASTIAGTAQYRATCSCDQMPRHPAGTHDQALAAHIAHISTRLGPSKGPEWLPVGARLVILMVAMSIVWGVFYITGQAVIHQHHLAGATAKALIAGFHLTGLASAFGLMVAARRYIAPTRD